VLVKLLETAASLGLPQPKLLPTTRESPGPQQARDALDQGADSIIAVGGDGTLRLVAGELGSSGVPLSVIPAGSGNIFARNIGMKVRDYSANVTLALTGKSAAVDLGWAQTNVSATPEPMLVMAGIGREAEAVALATPDLKRALGWGAYVPAIARKAFAPPMPMRVSLDGGPEQPVRAWSVLAANCPNLTMGMVAFPKAKLDDGVLEVMQMLVNNPLQWGPVAAKALANFEAPVSALSYTRGSDIIITTPHPLRAQVDGDDIAGVRELRVSLAPSALLVRVPEQAPQQGVAHD
jgi:diacylglycerol kinase family enzyme